MGRCSAIISDYKETNTLPGNMEDVAVDPLEQGSQLRFKARILTDESNATRSRSSWKQTFFTTSRLGELWSSFSPWRVKHPGARGCRRLSTVTTIKTGTSGSRPYESDGSLLEPGECVATRRKPPEILCTAHIGRVGYCAEISVRSVYYI